MVKAIIERQRRRFGENNIKFLHKVILTNPLFKLSLIYKILINTKMQWQNFSSSQNSTVGDDIISMILLFYWIQVRSACDRSQLILATHDIGILFQTGVQYSYHIIAKMLSKPICGAPQKCTTVHWKAPLWCQRLNFSLQMGQIVGQSWNYHQWWHY